ncbi:MAG: RNA polymerase sigma factor [Saprospiraceae bacterium]
MTTIEFTKQLDQFQNFLYNFALRLTQNQEKAKDLVQDTSLRAFRYKEKFQVGTNFKGWISTIMRNTFINQYRKDKKRRHVSEPVESFAYALEGQVITPNQGESNLRMQELTNMFESMSDLYSVPFLLYYRGYEYKEIADQLDLPIGTVKSRIHTARNKMKETIQARYQVV